MLNKLKSSKTLIQTLLLFGTQIFGMIIGFVSNMLLAKKMGSDAFGIYSFALAVISFLAIFFDFGYFASASRLLAINHDKTKEKELIGSSLVIVLGISVLFFITIFVVSLFIDDIFKDKIGKIIRIASIVSWSFIIPFFMELILKGSNHIEYLAGFNLLWKLLFVASLFALYFQNALIPLNALFSLSITAIISFVFFIIKLKPSFTNLKSNISQIHNENMVFGLQIYTGRVIDVSTYQLDRLFIGFFVGAKDVGLYSLANSMATPINSFSTALASSKFKDLANNKEIPRKVLQINLTWIVIATIAANTLGYIIIHHYLGQEYQGVFLLLVLMSFAVAFQAAYQPYNAWLSGHGYGREMKKLNYKMAFTSVSTNMMLIPFLGALGAAIASMISMFYTLYLYIRCYSASK